ncbi:uncharacterized protein LOC117180562 [Belonocnema kinseyi]|uniref:uncharacterized protein LOC117180562 n=1 Tax=Belonocnema kinseyi TaxID=2817044 RepID=UPI00143D8F68|nr:uncharacterized protein LOC117180562 [Belonocnema kinseyi]
MWLEYKKQLPLLNTVRYQRCIVLNSSIDSQLHGFCDASEKAYGACLYLRSTDNRGNYHCELICSKSRVAPLKTMTLSKLELCAAALLVQLFNSTIRSLQIDFSKKVFWSDSTIALNWINSPPHTLLTFIANRVSEIQATTKPTDWRHVPTLDNPADCISRGQGPHDFLTNTLWTHGPQWLSCHENNWPQFDFKLSEVPEKRSPKTVVSFKITQAGINIIIKYSNFKKLQHVIAYCVRFIRNVKIRVKTSRQMGPLVPNELNSASRIILKWTQYEVSSSEIRALSKGKQVDQKSSLFRLNPFLDDGLIRVGERLDRAPIPESQKHPIILPKNHHVTKLIIRDEHLKKLHAGMNATLYGVRETYWPIDGRNATRLIIRECVTCFRAKPREVNYLMENLPKTRLSLTQPIFDVGVDFCGPFYTKEHRHRNRTKIKTYVSVFVCFATKDVHLELASDLTTDAFLACLKRFFARRGIAQSMNSDNAKNFVGANNDLKKVSKQLTEMIESNKDQEFLSSKEINWRFIPPRAPHFGGLWEAGVKSFKYHFVRIAGNTLLTYEQLHTYVIEIEAILNSRPLTPLSSDPNDILPLTPAHFLIGSSLTALPQEDLRLVPEYRLNCRDLVQQKRQHFWNRWQKEYLNEMIARSKWQSTTHQDNIAIGTLVVVKEDNLPPLKRSLARIIEIHPGQDGIVREVTFKGKSGIARSALKTLYPLPID